MNLRLKKYLTSTFIIIPTIVGIIIFFSTSCKTDIKEVQALMSDTIVIPDAEVKEVTFYYTDSARLQLKVIAAELLRYEDEKEPYTEFPKGIEVIQYDDSLRIKSTIISDYAIYTEKNEIWRAERNIRAVNIDGDTLITDLLFWDTQNKKIYTNARVKIITIDGEIHGIGLDANQDFTNWEIRESTGTYYFDDDDI